MSLHPQALMPYEKYIQAFIRQPISGRRIVIGRFKEKGDKNILQEEFNCIVFGHGKAEECYKGAIAYFNFTIPFYNRKEKERIFVSAEWKKEDKNAD